MFLGSLFLPLGLLIYVSFHSFLPFVIAEFVVAMANSMRSGADSAFLYDSLLALQREKEYNRIEGKAFFYSRIGCSVSAVLGGLLALVSLKMPFFLNIGSSLLILPVVAAMAEPPQERLRVRISPLQDILKISRLGFQHPLMRHLILFCALLTTMGIVGIWSYFLYYRKLGISIGWFGVLFAIFQAFSAIGSRHAENILRRLRMKGTMWLFLIISINFLLLCFFSSPLMVGVIFLNAYIWGSSFPVFLARMNDLIDSRIRATLLSVANMTRSLLFVILAPVFGGIVNAWSLSAAYLFLGIMGILVSLLFITRILSHQRYRENTITF
jgi:MFS family permease